MFNIRFGLFETNSSSTHSLYFCSTKEYEDFEAGRLVINVYTGELVPRDEAIQDVIEAAKNSGHELWSDEEEHALTPEEFLAADRSVQDRILREYDYKMYATMGEYLEYYATEYTTPGGEKIVAFGEYGNDY